jgi:hypothetical protein
MKRIQTYTEFLSESELNEGIMTVGDLKIDTAGADKAVAEFIKDKITSGGRKTFKSTTGLDLDVLIKEVVPFIKDQARYVSPVLYKKDLTQVDLDKSVADLIKRVDEFVTKKTQEYLEKMPFKIKAGLSVIPESTLKKKIQDQNKPEGEGTIQAFIWLLGNIIAEQKIQGGSDPVINPKPATYQIAPGVKMDCYSEQKGPDGKYTPPAQYFSDRSNLFWTYLDENSFKGKNLVNHYIDLIVPILA